MNVQTTMSELDSSISVVTSSNFPSCTAYKLFHYEVACFDGFTLLPPEDPPYQELAINFCICCMLLLCTCDIQSDKTIINNPINDYSYLLVPLR